MNFIELFAGCGGLSLGLKSEGGNLLLANELSPMAAETYAFNFFNENLQEPLLAQEQQITNTRWLSSRYGFDNFEARLRENPNNYPSIGDGISEVTNVNPEDLRGSLIVGSIVELNNWLETRPQVVELLRTGFGENGLDVVSGGPPCQSFSMAGLRRQNCEKNTLPWEFAKFANMVRPRLVLLENVSGILRPFKDDLGNRYYAWYELAKAFAGIGYIPLCLHTNAKLAGVPQNRPRFIMIGVRDDVFQELNPTFNDAENQLFSDPFKFFELIQAGQDVDVGDELMRYRDVTKAEDLELFHNSFLIPLVARNYPFVSVENAIDDLRNRPVERGEFSLSLDQEFRDVPLPTLGEIQNHELRRNSDLVRRRFRIYQVLSQVDGIAKKEVQEILKGTSNHLTERSWRLLADFDYLNEAGNFVRFDNIHEFVLFLKQHPTKKQTQKALLIDQPAPAALSIPDDACHYHHDELRTLTVREMARIQSFPDAFEFRSKVTTGGDQRQYEVPQYTQVGNAVPPLLAKALGQVLNNLLRRL
ncbi:DNA cytosine methyltransferase [Leeia sp. TBRC 13508]|uniref:Cytosine-specific methyltransferase n=1 Tax=Leeia speluncae TaxID=2884804 RepID=A0ABS8D4F9_9NEIS|nr:DNA cytosine methyltransferase [Leeia speluncae]MCB6183012.1 DNA cytosine methyltransferase [Leeia speluncae]